MATPSQPTTSNPLVILKLFFSAILVSLFYFLGFYSSSSSNSTTTTTTITTTSLHHLQNPPLNCISKLNSTPHLSISPPLDYEPHHLLSLPPQPLQKLPFFQLCPSNFTNYMPCHDPSREKLYFTGKRFFHRERHCPPADERVKCLVPKPPRYKTPFSWPESRDYAWFNNVPSKKLTIYKKSQNWVRLEGNRLVFPGGGTSFPKGAKDYVEVIRRIVPLKSGKIRTVLDVGCGVASFGAALLDYGILTMSIAPRDIHEAQVQFALERGLPAMLGILSTYRLPYPSRSFDMVHCSRCLVPWTNYDGLYLMEIDRVLRPGGYWVLSGPPISWRVSYKGWEREAKDLENEQISLENLAKRLCWKKIAERNPIAVWRKPTNHVHCIRKLKVLKSPLFCAPSDPDAAWIMLMQHKR